MALADLARLVTLAALWGGAFILFKIAAPVLGALLTAELRVAFGWIALTIYALVVGERVALRERWKGYLIIGLVSSALPFSLVSFSSMHLSAGLNAIINGASPLFGAIAAALLLGDRLTFKRVAALALGMLGIVVLVGDPAIGAGPMIGWALAAALASALCYGFAGVLTKLVAADTPPIAMSAGTQLAATLALIPLLPLAPPPGPITISALAATVAMGVFCSGFGYVLYFKLLANIGPVRTLLVTFLIPVFGVIFGVIFLGESITWRTIAGGAIVLLAVWIETRGRRALSH